MYNAIPGAASATALLPIGLAGRVVSTCNGNDDTDDVELGELVTKDDSRDGNGRDFLEDTGDGQRDDTGSLDDAGISRQRAS